MNFDESWKQVCMHDCMCEQLVQDRYVESCSWFELSIDRRPIYSVAPNRPLML